MRGRRTDRRQIIICIVAVCFLIGIAVGALSQRSLDANQTERLAVYADAVKCDNTGFTGCFTAFPLHTRRRAGEWAMCFRSCFCQICCLCRFTYLLPYGPFPIYCDDSATADPKAV